MKKVYFQKSIMLIIGCILSLMNASGQVTSSINDSATVYPLNPTETDSVYVYYSYTSNDGCPDFYLMKDSVVAGKIYVSLKNLPGMGRICPQIVTKFTAKINLGTFTADTQIYFNGKLIRTVYIPCSMNKQGVVVTCGNKLYIQDISSTLTVIQLYSFSNGLITDSKGITYNMLKQGDHVKFGGYLFANDSFTVTTCRTVGIATCYQLIDTIPTCIMNKVGIVVQCSNQQYIEDLSSPVASALPQLYTIKGITNNSGTPSLNLKTGDKVKFGGNIIKNDSVSSTLCPIVGVAACYELTDTSSTCIMDKKGIVVEGIGGCTGRLFIKEILTQNLYSINNFPPVLANATILTGLKAGDKVIFGGYLTNKDLTSENLCPVAGVATCHRLIDTVATCVKDKQGIVVRGSNACSEQLFVRETTSQNLYYIKTENIIYSDGSVTRNLNVGDKIKFGAVLINPLSSAVNLCNAVGIVTCYEITASADTLMLAGNAIAGDEIMKTGLAILFEKGYRKASALSLYNITDGIFEFKGLPQSAYTVYVLPDRDVYKNYLPTFYVDKVYYKDADFIELNQSTKDVTVKMKYFDRKTGTGQIYGNIFFESNQLNDSLLVKNALMNTNGSADYNLAVNATVLLLNSKNLPVAWTLTDVNGNYVFNEIPLDTFTVVSETASAYAASTVRLTTENNPVKAVLVMKNLQYSTGLINPENSMQGIFPIPAKDKLTVTVIENSEINIYNLAGQLLLRHNLTAGVNTLDLTTISKGVLIVKIGNNAFKLIKE
jgi:hypothetical protein